MSDNSAHCPFFLSSLPTVVNTSNHPSAFTPSQMTEQNPKTIMPALLDNKATKVSDSHPNQKPQASSQSLMNSDRSTHWPDLQCPVTFDQTSQGSELEISTEHLTERSIKQDDAWNYVSHQRPPSYASCSFAYNSNFCLDQGLGMYPPLNSMIQLCGLPLPNGPSQRSGAPRAPAYDAAPSLAPSLYATASNLRTPNWANIHDVLGGRRNDSAIMDSDDSDGEGNQGEPPYASLIYQALMEAPNHQMVLKEIYEWIAQNTDKARDPAFKGWQNSVRHNLSMNGAFRKEPYVDPANKSKKGFIWVLEPSAVGKGIESTTRYRQKTIGKRSDNPAQADPKRQRSGRKGGRAARNSANSRRSTMLDSSRYPRSLGSSGPQLALKIEPPQQNLSHHDWTSSNGHPYYLTPPLSSTTSSFYEHDSLNYGDLVGDVDAQSDQHLFGQADLFGEPFECSNDSIQSSTSAYKFDDNLLGAGIAAFS